MHACELDGAWGGDQSFEVLERGGLHLVVTEVVLVDGGWWGRGGGGGEFLCCSVFD